MKNYDRLFFDNACPYIHDNEFILNYRIKNDTIVVYYASGKTETLEYSKEAIDELENQLKKQIEHYKPKIESVPFIITGVYTLSATILFLIIRLVYLMHGNTTFLTNIPITKEMWTIGAIFIIGGFPIEDFLSVIDAKKDLKKNKLLLENLEKINIELEKNREEVLEKLKTKNIDLESRLTESDSIKLNDADLFTKHKISRLVRQIDTEETTVSSKNKPKMRIRKR